jgi:hypothetical protein
MIPPAELEAAYYAQIGSAETVDVTQPSLHRTRGGSGVLHALQFARFGTEGICRA